MRYAGLILLLPLLDGCALGPAPQGQPPPPDTVKSMVLHLRADTLDGVSQKQTEAIAAKIAENLKSWGYPVQTAGSAANGASHILESWSGKPERKSLPPGFTLSFGSDDQRAPERQKTDVVTVGCALLPAAGGGGKASLSGEFGVAEGGKSLFSGTVAADKEGFYVDRMGSVCLNLLAELKVAKQKPQESTLTPAWIPSMRVEIKTKEGKSKPGVELPPKPVSMPAGNPPAAVSGKPDKPAAATAAKPEPADQPVSQTGQPAVTTEEKTDAADQRKQLIIHNQGSPIILEFGYDADRGMGQ